MAKDPAVLFYTQDFLMGTSFFTPMQKGHYITLLCHQQQHENGSLSIDQVKAILGKDFEKNWPAIIQKFKEDSSGFFNERMRFEIERRKKFCQKQSDRAKPRHNHGNTTASPSALVEPIKKHATEIETGFLDEGLGETFFKPGESEKLDLLSDIDISGTIEYVRITSHKILTHQNVVDHWEAFKIQHFTGEKGYNGWSDVKKHFRDWLKKQKSDAAANNDHSKPGGKLGTSAARIEKARNW